MLGQSKVQNDLGLSRIILCIDIWSEYTGKPDSVFDYIYPSFGLIDSSHIGPERGSEAGNRDLSERLV